jgi:hypothetical protein
MASKRHSQITPATTQPALSDQIVGVRSAATDQLWSLSQIAAVVGGGGSGGGGGGSGTANTKTFTSKSAFTGGGVVPADIDYVYVQNVGTFPAPAGQENIPLTYRRVASSTLFGNVTVGGQVWEPIYARNPVNAGEFGLVSDGATVQNFAGPGFFGTANGTATITAISQFNGPSDTSGIQVGQQFAVVNYAALGSGFAPQVSVTVLSKTTTTITLSAAVLGSGAIKFTTYNSIGFVTGTNNAPMIQQAIDFAIQNGCSVVKLPYGKYRIDDTLHVGWGNTPCELTLMGASRPNYLGGVGSGNPILYPTKTDRPAINVQGSRRGGVKGIEITGLNINYCIAQAQGYFNRSGTAADWLAPELNPTGSNPGGLTRYTPYAGITVDAYSAVPQATNYPPRTIPAWVQALGYNWPNGWNASNVNVTAFSSEVIFEDCEVGGFAACIVNQPNQDGNGDFTRFRQCSTLCSPYGIVICNTQSRSVEIRNGLYQYHHTMITNKYFGAQGGGMYGPIDNNHGGQCWQTIDLYIGTSGNVDMSHTYVEDVVRVGDITGSATGPSVTMHDCNFFLGDQGGHGNIPKSIIGVSGVDIIIINTAILGHTRITQLAGALSPGVACSLNIIGGIWQCAATGVSFLQTQDAPHQLAVNYTGGLLLGCPRFNANFGARSFTATNLRGSFFSTPTNNVNTIYHDTIMNKVTPPSRRQMSQMSTQYVDSQGRNWRMTVPGEQPVDFSTLSAAYPGNDDMLHFNYSDSLMASGIFFAIAPGDILFHETTGTIFIVTSVGASGSGGAGLRASIAHQQNNLKTDPHGSGAFVANLITASQLNTGLMTIIKTNIWIPSVLYYGTYTAASTTISNINRGDGDGTAFTTYYQNGDLMYGVSWCGVTPAGGAANVSASAQYPLTNAGGGTAPWGAQLSAVTNGAAPGGSAVMQMPVTGAGAFPAPFTGTFPLFPYELR